MAKGSAEEVLKVIEGLKKEPNISITFIVDEYEWHVVIRHKCLDAYTHKEWWNTVDGMNYETFIEALDFAVGFEEEKRGKEDGIS